jgi:hypothetical protein
MTAPVPPIPATCEHRPTIGGFVRPWINIELGDGGIDFRGQHRARAEQAIIQQLCQVCGKRLRRPIVLLGRADELQHLMFDEPPLHPECAAYTSHACPMVAGRMTHHPNRPQLVEGPRGARCPVDGCDCGGWVPARTADESTEERSVQPWYAVYVAGYSSARDQNGTLLVLATPALVLRVRLVSRPGEGRLWIPVTEALKHYRAPTFQTLGTTPGGDS